MLHHLPGLFVLLAVGGLGYFLLLVWVIGWKLSHPPRRTYVSAVVRNIAGEPGELSPPLGWSEWRLGSGGLELPVWDIAGLEARGPVVILTHGWGDSRIGALARIGHMSRFASRLIAWDMPGHGEAPGRSRLGRREVADLVALIDRVGAEGVVLYGWSLGAGVSIAAAVERRSVVGVIAEAPYRLPMTPARNVMRASDLPSGLALRAAMLGLGFSPKVVERFDRALIAARVECPLLVLHGEDDRICPEADGRAIAEAARLGCFVSIAQGTHNGLWVRAESVERCVAAVARFGPLRSYDSTDAECSSQPDG
ncbi:MAG: alpha/beta hydrolase [Phycisphaeraceae bacterium]|nr:alpha/beta hydrolase [Phycisphaeraceae bacterium]MCW5764295.1 alpha/beta hydrolase [Phycisphaeraceae bacterium]